MTERGMEPVAPGEGWIDAAVVSICGPARAENEDAALVVSLGDGAAAGLVADGMGGHEAGREAAEIVVRVIAERLRQRQREPWAEVLRLALFAAHDEVCRQSRQRGGSVAHPAAGMGSTALVAVIEPKTEGVLLHLAHAGDSRAYLGRGRALLALTEDHSRVAQWVRSGHLAAAEAAAHPERNVLERAVGQTGNFEPEVQPALELDRGDRIFLVSDGVHAALAHSELELAALVGGSAAEACDAVVAAALGAASDDNISVLCLRLPEPSQNRAHRPTRPTLSTLRETAPWEGLS